MENKETKGQNILESGIFKKILGKAEDYIKKPSRVKDLINDTYKKASENKDIGTIAHEVWESVQTLSRLIKAAVSGEYTGIPKTTIVLGIAVLIYFISPIDIIPDFIPVVGLLDDISLLAWFMTSIKGEMDRFAEWERGSHLATEADAAASKIPVPQNTISQPPSAYKESATTGTFTSVDATSTSTNQPGNTAQVPLTKPGEELLVKDFTAHDAPVSPNDSAIRASSSGSGEPSVRAATTDSTRMPNSNTDDMHAGGNIR